MQLLRLINCLLQKHPESRSCKLAAYAPIIACLLPGMLEIHIFAILCMQSSFSERQKMTASAPGMSQPRQASARTSQSTCLQAGACSIHTRSTQAWLCFVSLLQVVTIDGQADVPQICSWLDQSAGTGNFCQ